jgi:SAM-dependent methyltransferase
MSAQKVQHFAFNVGQRHSRKGMLSIPHGIAAYRESFKVAETKYKYASPVAIIAAKAKEKSQKTWVLDACCGAGRFLNEAHAELISRGISHNIGLVGIDIMYQKYQVTEYRDGEKCPASDINKCEDHYFYFVEGDILTHRFFDEIITADKKRMKLDGFQGFDVIFMHNALQYIERKLETIENIYNMLALGGEAYIHLARRLCMVDVNGKLIPFEESILPEIVKDRKDIEYQITASAVILRLKRSKYNPTLSFNAVFSRKEKHLIKTQTGSAESIDYVVSVYKKKDQPG